MSSSKNHNTSLIWFLYGLKEMMNLKFIAKGLSHSTFIYVIYKILWIIIILYSRKQTFISIFISLCKHIRKQAQRKKTPAIILYFPLPLCIQLTVLCFLSLGMCVICCTRVRNSSSPKLLSQSNPE